MTQYAVVWRPDLTHFPRALGPYRSRAKADQVADAMLDLEDELGLVAGFDDDALSFIPEVVPLEDWSTVQRELREQHPEPSGPECQHGYTPDQGCPWCAKRQTHEPSDPHP